MAAERGEPTEEDAAAAQRAEERRDEAKALLGSSHNWYVYHQTITKIYNHLQRISYKDIDQTIMIKDDIVRTMENLFTHYIHDVNILMVSARGLGIVRLPADHPLHSDDWISGRVVDEARPTQLLHLFKGPNSPNPTRHVPFTLNQFIPWRVDVLKARAEGTLTLAHDGPVPTDNEVYLVERHLDKKPDDVEALRELVRYWRAQSNTHLKDARLLARQMGKQRKWIQGRPSSMLQGWADVEKMDKEVRVPRYLTERYDYDFRIPDHKYCYKGLYRPY